MSGKTGKSTARPMILPTVKFVIVSTVTKIKCDTPLVTTHARADIVGVNGSLIMVTVLNITNVSYVGLRKTSEYTERVNE
jgi:hypothetical protein